MDNEGTQSEDENTNDSYTDSKTGIDSAHGAMDCLVAVGRLQSSLDKPIGKTFYGQNEKGKETSSNGFSTYKCEMGILWNFWDFLKKF